MRWWWMKPMPKSGMKSPFAVRKSNVWKERLSVAYAFFAFNSLVVVIYCCLKGKADWAEYYGFKSEEEAKMRPGRQWSRTLGIQNATVYKVSGFTNVGKYEINGEDTGTKQDDVISE